MKRLIKLLKYLQDIKNCPANHSELCDRCFMARQAYELAIDALNTTSDLIEMADIIKIVGRRDNSDKHNIKLTQTATVITRPTGLAYHPIENTVIENKKYTWAVTHVPSGWCVIPARSRRDCLRVIKLLLPLTDFTIRDPKEVKAACIESAKELGFNSLEEYIRCTK